jgi:hypothetical protein
MEETAKMQSFSANKENQILKYEESCEVLNSFMHSENEPKH